MSVTERMLVMLIECCQGDMSDRAFAKHIGVKGNTWWQTRRGCYPLGWAVLTGVISRYPELSGYIIGYMALVGQERIRQEDLDVYHRTR